MGHGRGVGHDDLVGPDGLACAAVAVPAQHGFQQALAPGHGASRALARRAKGHPTTASAEPEPEPEPGMGNGACPVKLAAGADGQQQRGSKAVDIGVLNSVPFQAAKLGIRPPPRANACLGAPNAGAGCKPEYYC